MPNAETADVTAGGPPRSASASAPPAADADQGLPTRWWILAVLAAVAFMAQLDGM